MKDYQFHEYCEILPRMSDEEFNALCEDMRENGFREENPIFLYKGKILDGRNRYLAAKVAEVTPLFTEYRGDNPLQFVISQNVNRRHLSESQRGVIAESLANMNVGRNWNKSNSANLPNNKISQSDAAEMLNVSTRLVTYVSKIRRESPESIDDILSGKKTVTQVIREIKETNRESRREDNREKVVKMKSPLESGAKFSTIVLDPPWDWGDEGDADQLGRAKPTYSTMSLEQLLELPVEKLVDDDCHIYLWITNRSLPKGFALLEKWGFRYITALTWPKPSFGMGNYFRGQTEQVLFGVKGSQMLKRKDASTLLPQWKRGPKGHSSKPVEFYDFVESCSPGPYLEMFARSDRDDWTSWGAEV